MIIKLTEIRKDGPHSVCVNMDQIQYFSKSMNGNDTRLKVAGDNLYLFVKESVEDIMKIMYPVPMMTGELVEWDYTQPHKPGFIDMTKRYVK